MDLDLAPADGPAIRRRVARSALGAIPGVGVGYGGQHADRAGRLTRVTSATSSPAERVGAARSMAAFRAGQPSRVARDDLAAQRPGQRRGDAVGVAGEVGQDVTARPAPAATGTRAARRRVGLGAMAEIVAPDASRASRATVADMTRIGRRMPARAMRRTRQVDSGDRPRRRSARRVARWLRSPSTVRTTSATHTSDEAGRAGGRHASRGRIPTPTANCSTGVRYCSSPMTLSGSRSAPRRRTAAGSR